MSVAGYSGTLVTLTKSLTLTMDSPSLWNLCCRLAYASFHTV